MNIFKRFASYFKRQTISQQVSKGALCETASEFSLTDDGYFYKFYIEPQVGDSYLLNAWVNIAVNILIRNIARADFCLKLGGKDITDGPIYNLFRKPNSALSRDDLWKETAAW